MRWLVLLALLVGCGWYEPLEDGMRNARPIEYLGPPRGIWQGPNPPQGTVRDCCNISTHRGYWASRPGKVQVVNGGQQFFGSPVCSAEFIPDERYEDNDHYAIVNIDAGSQFGKEVLNSESQNNIAMHDEYTPNLFGTRADWIQCLWKFHKSTDDDGTKVYARAPALLFSRGVDPPFVYHQKDGTGTFEALESIDGGDTDITYLGDPRRGKHLAIYKERIFMANIVGGQDAAGNRLFFTGPDDALTWNCNTWPAEYNLDVGSGNEEITALKVFRDWLVIFKENSIWVLSGDGVNGVWDVQEIDGANGALEWCVEDVGQRLVFFNRTGAYMWSGGLAKRISHPQLQETWPTLSFNSFAHTGYDPERKIVLFATGSGSVGQSGHRILVYDVENNAWTRWGTWRGDDGAPQDYAYASMFVPLKKFYGHPVLAFSAQLRLFKWEGFYDNSYVFGSSPATNPIHWFIQTQRLFDQDSSTKIARRAMVYAKKTGDWNVRGLVCQEGESPADAMRRKAGDKWNLIMDSADAVSHDINGQSQFMRSSDGPVDVMYPLVNYKMGDALRVVTGSDSDKVVFASAFDSTGAGSGYLMIIPEDTSGIVQFPMSDGDTMGESTGETIYQEPDFVKLYQSVNATGRNFTLWLSNVGDENVVASDIANGWYAVIGMPFEALGWGVWVIPTRGVR